MERRRQRGESKNQDQVYEKIIPRKPLLFVFTFLTRKSQDQWDRYLNGVEDKGEGECGTYSRGKGLKIVGSSA